MNFENKIFLKYFGSGHKLYAIITCIFNNDIYIVLYNYVCYEYWSTAKILLKDTNTIEGRYKQEESLRWV